MIIWLTGQPGSGKTTLAKLIVKNLDCDYLYINASDENEEIQLLSKDDLPGLDPEKTLNAIDKAIEDAKISQADITKVVLVDEGTITQEVAKGYISFQEVLRPSKVIVSKKK